MALSETVKAFSSALGIPTLSASFGQQNDSQQWRNLDDRKKQYLIQVMPPLDIIPEVVRAIVKELNITNAAILFDDWFGKFFLTILNFRLLSFGNVIGFSVVSPLQYFKSELKNE